MTMHPELQLALNTGVPISEVIRIFSRHHPAPIDEPNDEDLIFWFDYLVKDQSHSNYLFWDAWKPLFRRFTWYRRGSCLFRDHVPSDSPFFSIHGALTKEIISWLCDSNRRSNVYLIAEPHTPELHAKRNSRARVLAGIYSQGQRCKQAFATQGSVPLDASEVYELSFDLALTYPSFRRILTSTILIDNPQVIKLPTRTQFKKLILEPWIAVLESHPEYITTPPVIVLRWDKKIWDEELLHLICETCSSLHFSSPLWIISIDTNFKLPIQDLFHSSAPVEYFRLPVVYDDGPADVALILRHEFTTLRHRCQDMFDEGEVWPSEEQMSELVRIVSGAFESVDVIIRFIDWEGGGGPKAHLETFLAYMVDSPSPSDKHPHCALDHFYFHALSDLPPDILRVVKEAFSIVRWRRHKKTNPLEIACLLSLGEDISIHYLKRLAVIGTGYNKKSCLCGFLEDPKRSKQFYISKSESLYRFLNSSLHILNKSSNLTAILKPAGRWNQVDAKAYSDLIGGLGIADVYWLSVVGLGRYGRVPDARNEAHAGLWRRFDFRCLAHICDRISRGSLFQLAKILHAFDKVHSSNLVRIKPVCLLDRQFIATCEGLAEPMDLKEKKLTLSNPKYVLLGFGTETVLAVLAARENYGETDRGVNIYTSAMLDYM